MADFDPKKTSDQSQPGDKKPAKRAVAIAITTSPEIPTTRLR